MRTVLDDVRLWVLETVLYQEENLNLILAELIAGEEVDDSPTDEKVDDAPTDARGVEQVLLRYTRPAAVRDDSRRVVVRFPQTVAWQVVDESYTTWDDYEERDDESVLQIISRSRYLDYVLANHGWFQDSIGPAKQYRVWTVSDVVDVVACNPPTVQPREAGT